MIKTHLILLILFALHSCNEKDEEPKMSISAPSQEVFKVNLDTIHEAFDTRVQETSGIMKVKDTYWTHNDSGGEPNLYQIDMKTGDLLRTVSINGVKNDDWEEISTDGEYFYIGNFGNNLGQRDNLEIYKGEIDDLLLNDSVDVEKIQFSYNDQSQFYDGYGHNHDCEAMIVHEDNIYLFSKNWLDRRCKMYKVPTKPGTYKLDMVSDFNCNGTITGAAISPDHKELILLGYMPIPRKGFDPFVWKISDWEGDDFLSGEKRRYDFYIRRQMEAVLYDNSNTLIISAEDENGSDPSLYRMNL